MKQVHAILFFLLSPVLLTACAVKSTPNHEFKLADFDRQKIHEKHRAVSILVTEPEAAAGYQTDNMLYSSKPFELQSFAYNAWAGRPAKMLLPLILQSLQYTGYFYAVTSSPYGDSADYRLDTQLIEFQQNFILKPSTIQLVVKLVLTSMQDGQVMASEIMSICIPCPEDTPFGGVIAANLATKQFTKKLIHFVIQNIKKDRGVK